MWPITACRLPRSWHSGPRQRANLGGGLFYATLGRKADVLRLDAAGRGAALFSAIPAKWARLTALRKIGLHAPTSVRLRPEPHTPRVDPQSNGGAPALR